MAGPGIFNRSRIASPSDATDGEGPVPDGFYEQLRAKEHLVRDQLREQLKAFLPKEEEGGSERRRKESADGPHIPSLEDFLTSLDLEDDPLDPEVLADSTQEAGFEASSGSRAAARGPEDPRPQASWFSDVGGHGQPSGSSSRRLRRGQAVVVQGLQRRSELNGSTGELGRYDDEKGRWQVLLDAREPLWMRPANLEPRTPVPVGAPSAGRGLAAGLSRSELYGDWLVVAETDFVATVCEGGRTLYDGHYMGRDHDIDAYGSGRSIIIERAEGWKVDVSRSSPDLLVWTRPGEEDVCWRRLREATAEYLVDNSRLQAGGPGLGYRLSKSLDDRADDSEYAPWGKTVQGIDRGGGWVQIGLRFLPRLLGGLPVLLSEEELQERERSAPPQPAGEGGRLAAPPASGEAAIAGDEAGVVPGYEELMAMLGGEGDEDAEEPEEAAPVYDKDDMTVVSLITLRVTSAGDPACNGTFHYESPHKGRPLYKSDNGAIVYFSQCWKMNSCYKTTGWVYSVEDSSSQLPPSGPWAASGSKAGEDGESPPALQIRGQVLRILAEKGALLKLEDGRIVARKDENKSWCRGAPFQ